MQVTDLAACEFEPGSASRVMLGREGGGMLVYDLEAQKPAAKVHISLQQILGLVTCHSMGTKQFPSLHLGCARNSTCRKYILDYALSKHYNCTALPPRLSPSTLACDQVNISSLKRTVFDSWLVWFQHILLVQMIVRQGRLTVKQHIQRYCIGSGSLGFPKPFKILNLLGELDMK